jgi:hypothetical protein
MKKLNSNLDKDLKVRVISLMVFIGITFIVSSAYAQKTAQSKNKKTKVEQKEEVVLQDTLSWSVSLLNRIFNSGGEWYFTDEAFRKPVKGVFDYATNEPIDSAVVDMRKILKTQDSLIYLFERRPQDISDRSKVRGYINSEEEAKQIEERTNFVKDSLRSTNIQLPPDRLDAIMKDKALVPQGDPQEQVYKVDYLLPAPFKAKFYKNLSLMPLPPNMTGAEMDSLRLKVFIWSKQAYNDSIIWRKSDSLLVIYREQFIADYAANETDKLKESIDARNLKSLTAFNDTEVAKMNDSLRVALNFLTANAEADSVLIRITNLSGEKSKLWTANRDMLPIRTYLKNAQNDSLGVVLYNDGKGSLKLVIDDGVIFTRFTESQKREATLPTKAPDQSLQKMELKKVEQLPWTLFGNGSVGFTQTALVNWAKGGESSLSMLFTGRYNANYSKDKMRWENSAEFRYGLTQMKSRGFEKTDDKIEIQSRYGYSAFKQWYYSAESNFRTQIAHGYKYPDKDNPFSAFMAPGYLTFSIGMDYKPHKDFSLFLSPFTSKTTYVLDTALIDPTYYGLDPGQKKLWEPGMIVKVNWKTKVTENISYETRAELFNNYKYTLQKFTFDWEQMLVMQVNQYISTRILTQTIYDYNTKFPVYDDQGNETGRKAKWQFKEFFTIGFNYKF